MDSEIGTFYWVSVKISSLSLAFLYYLFLLLRTLCFFLLFSSLVVLILLHLLNVVLFASSSLSVRSSPRAFSLHRFNHVSSSLHLSSRTAPVMVCSTMQLWAEMLLVPHQSTSCPARCPRMCTAEWHNRSVPLGCFLVCIIFNSSVNYRDFLQSDCRLVF